MPRRFVMGSLPSVCLPHPSEIGNGGRHPEGWWKAVRHRPGRSFRPPITVWCSVS